LSCSPSRVTHEALQRRCDCDETQHKRLWIEIGCNAEMPAQGGLKEKTALWKFDCERSGQSGTNVSVAAGLTATILTLLGAVSGYAACRVWLLCLCAPVSRLAKP